MKRWLKYFLVLWFTGTLGTIGFFSFMYWKDLYPNYLMFQSTYAFQNNFYGIQLTCFAINLWFSSQHMSPQSLVDIAAYWRIFTLEENYQDRWNLECFDNRTEKNSTVETFSHIYTQTIKKHWVFNKDEPTFLVKIWRTYQFDSENMNNQIIIDVRNNGIYLISNRTVVYQTEIGVFGYRILEAEPNNITIQTGHQTETQLNFYGAQDRDMRFHQQGETEYVKLLVYANQYGTIQDATYSLSSSKECQAKPN